MIQNFKGIFRNDIDARAAYSEAADISQLIPQAVAVPEDDADVIALLEWSRKTKTPITARGSGSSMGGGAIGSGVILDMSRFNWIGDIDTANKTVRVGPGAIRAAVDKKAREFGLRFPPDPSSGRFCTVGGMVSTNAAGSHTLGFGPTRDWVQSVDCILVDGSTARFERGKAPVLDHLSSSETSPAQKADSEPGNAVAESGSNSNLHAHELFNKLDIALQEQLRPLYDRGLLSKPNLFKESSGYALSKFVESGDILDLIIGSEGTLAIITSIVLKLSEVRPATSSVLASFDSLENAVAAAIKARNFGATACELLDKTYLEIAAKGTDLSTIPAGTEAVLLAELEGDSTEDSSAQAERLGDAFRSQGATTVTLALSAAAEHEMWEMRHAASPTLNKLGPTHTSMQFIEDCGLPPDKFPEFIRGIREIFAIHNVPGVIFGHAGDCHAHVNPLINVHAPDWREKVTSILNMTVDLTARLGGTLAAEHGDGRLRAPLLPKVWAPETIAAFKAVKEAFDPDNILNPGVIVPLSGQNPLYNIKYDPNLPKLPTKVREMLDTISTERGYSNFRLDSI